LDGGSWRRKRTVVMVEEMVKLSSTYSIAVVVVSTARRVPRSRDWLDWLDSLEK
jgi:hypothetical protein